MALGIVTVVLGQYIDLACVNAAGIVDLAHVILKAVHPRHLRGSGRPRDVHDEAPVDTVLVDTVSGNFKGAHGQSGTCDNQGESPFFLKEFHVVSVIAAGHRGPRFMQGHFLTHLVPNIGPADTVFHIQYLFQIRNMIDALPDRAFRSRMHYRRNYGNLPCSTFPPSPSLLSTDRGRYCGWCSCSPNSGSIRMARRWRNCAAASVCPRPRCSRCSRCSKARVICAKMAASTGWVRPRRP